MKYEFESTEELTFIRIDDKIEDNKILIEANGLGDCLEINSTVSISLSVIEAKKLSEVLTNIIDMS